MTYRDDRDATLARADALQKDLERAEAERDRLRVQVDRLEHERKITPAPVPPPEPAPPVQTIVTARSHALTSREVESLVQDVERGFQRARSDMVSTKVFGVVILLGSVAMYFVTSLLYAVIATVIGLVLIVAHFIDSMTNDDLEVLAALRDHPDEILELVEGRGDVTIVTRTKSATCSTPQVVELFVALARYCPSATPRRRTR